MYLLRDIRLIMQLVAGVMCITFCDVTYGKSKNLGIGVQVIDVTGFTVKQKQSRKKAVEAAIAWDHSGDRFEVTASGAYLKIWPDFMILGDDKMDGVLGGGAKVSTRNNRIELRVPAGLSWMILEDSLEIYGYIIPGMMVYPKTDLSISMALGCRYFF